MAAESDGKRSSIVLVVDDDADVRAAVQLVLERNGYATAGVSDGQQALAWLDCHSPPALIMLDLMMPVMDGWQVLDALSADVRFASIPVVVTTAFGRDLGSAATRPLLRKPFELRDILRVVGEYTRQQLS